MDLTEAEDIKKRGQEYTEELYKKDLHDPDNHNGVDLTEAELRGGKDTQKNYPKKIFTTQITTMV